ncbi:hypothetical protein TraAM80_08698 [Trypanosoma rangeli]|uniref:Uncharacterized protein n=1 Tax=Trypanosoma rangeli TaxID=5698 RepID=A0A422MZE6_TRYRA|nr:uncharacterized protein TraAM80_08698 [Trypanosoma rangeli]RNE98551.1 hypothetical protein TraAM80_08698 [Trypanosoma rangeli]|eukprot:RNE98551.1 hypothetical protein TraAM80_08698 [Trypanosoma rangeli]
MGAVALLKRASTAQERLGPLSVTYLLCTSVDGVHFYGANAPLWGAAGDAAALSSLTTAAPRAAASPVENVGRLPLVLRVDPNMSGSYYTRDMDVVHQLVVRPRVGGGAGLAALGLESSAKWLVLFQCAVALLLQVDPAIIVVLLSNRTVVEASVLVTNVTASGEHVTYTLSLSLLADARVGRRLEEEAAGTLTASSELLLRYALLLRSNDTQASLFSTLLPPAARGTGLVTVQALYVKFTFDTEVDLHSALAQHSYELPYTPSEGTVWRARFATVPHESLLA